MNPQELVYCERFGFILTTYSCGKYLSCKPIFSANQFSIEIKVLRFLIEFRSIGTFNVLSHLTTSVLLLVLLLKIGSS